MPPIHTFTIEIPSELQLTDEERATLEGQFRVDAGNLLDRKLATGSSGEETNVNNVRVRFRQQPRSQQNEADRTGASEE